MIEYRDVQAAQARIAPHIVRTPLLRVPALDEALGCQVYLKHEGFQTIGAFKLRGALNKALSLSEEELGRGLVCASSGNHAQGVAYAAHKLGAQAVIVMPTNANPVKLAGVKRWGWWAPSPPSARNGPPSWCGSGAWWRSTPTPTRW